MQLARSGVALNVSFSHCSSFNHRDYQRRNWEPGARSVSRSQLQEKGGSGQNETECHWMQEELSSPNKFFFFLNDNTTL